MMFPLSRCIYMQGYEFTTVLHEGFRMVLLWCGSGSVCTEGDGLTPDADVSRRLSSSETRYFSSGLGCLGFFSMNSLSQRFGPEAQTQ